MISGRKLPIGIQDFESLRKDGYVYVDKTEYIYRLVNSGKPYFLSRPRRFGKSLFLSTLRAYFEGKKELFAGLKITELEGEGEDAWQTYPVFFFDFNKDEYQREAAIESVLEGHLEKWEEQYKVEKGTRSLAGRFQKLIEKAYEVSGRGAVVLVDEYDKSLLESDENRLERNKTIFKGFFSTLKSYDRYLKFVFLTGVTKFSKVSIFSDLNQLNDFSYGEEGVYNPFSLLNALSKKNFGMYWFATGTPTFLIEKLKESGFDAKRFTGDEFYEEEANLTDYRVESDNPVPLFYQTGYLTIKGYDREFRSYALTYPNEEVKYGFLRSLAPYYLCADEKANPLDFSGSV